MAFSGLALKVRLGREHLGGDPQQELKLLLRLGGCVSLNAEHVGVLKEISKENLVRPQALDTVRFSQGGLVAEG